MFSCSYRLSLLVATQRSPLTLLSSSQNLVIMGKMAKQNGISFTSWERIEKMSNWKMWMGTKENSPKRKPKYPVHTLVRAVVAVINPDYQC